MRESSFRATLVLLEAGSRVPADLRLDRAEGLRCDEALLTGESRPVPKEAGADAAAVTARLCRHPGGAGPRSRGCHGDRGGDRRSAGSPR